MTKPVSGMRWMTCSIWVQRPQGEIQRVGESKKTTFLFVVKDNIICISPICHLRLHLFQLFSLIACPYIAAGQIQLDGVDPLVGNPLLIQLNQQAKSAQSVKVTVSFEPIIQFENYIVSVLGREEGYI